MSMTSIKLEVEVWANREGALHLKSDDPRLAKSVDVEIAPDLEAARVLRAAVHAADPEAHAYTDAEKAESTG